jgi:long-subunit acyl-CoA synthetase (AMP-forming)
VGIYSCSFIETADIGKVYADGRFEIIGRMENAILRGCNLLIE